jgi:hypothetical protein
MINRIALWFITRTATLRAFAVAITGLLIGWGVVDESDQGQIAAAIALILTGSLSLLIETKKGTHVISRQRDLNQKQDGYYGPKTLAADRNAQSSRTGNPNRR